MLLDVKDITVHYGSAEAIKGITIEMTEASVLSIIGSNGAGKSTILKSISGLIPLSSGEILFSGEKINGMAVDHIVRRGIAHVPEGRRLFPYMSVLSNLKLGAYICTNKAVVNADLQAMFELFPPLKSRYNQRAGSLSGGEQQMVAIARALMARPKLLLMDEPSLGLAPLVIEQVGDVIEEINNKGIGVLLVEQNAGLVTRVSDQGYVIEVGKIVLEGNIRQLMQSDLVRMAFLGG